MDRWLDRLLELAPARTLVTAMLAVLGLTLLAGTLYGLKPGYLTFASLGGDSEAVLQGILTRAQTAQAEAQRLEREIEGLHHRVFGGASGLPMETIESRVVGTLDQLASSHGVRLVGVLPGEISQVLEFDELAYEVEVAGSYFSVYAWLRDVEEELRPMSIKQFALRPSGGGVSASLRLVSYRVTES